MPGFVTLNPVVGCPNGCEWCYARRIAERHGMSADFSRPEWHPGRLSALSATKAPCVVFLDSMSDFGTWRVGWLAEVLAAVDRAPQNEYLMLTKRPDLAARPEVAGMLRGRRNVWVGTSVTRADDLWRLDALRLVGAESMAVSFEPLVGPVGRPPLAGVGWVSVGAMTGPHAASHPVRPSWVADVVAAADEAGAAVDMRGSLRGIPGVSWRGERPAAVDAVLRGEPRPGDPSFDSLLAAAGIAPGA